LNIYADTSVFVALHLSEAHSAEARRRINQKQRLWLTPLHRAEWTHAIAQHVFRGAISDQEAFHFYAAFEADRKSNLWMESSISAAAYERAVELARKHASQMAMRTLDTLHIACALEFGAGEFWTFDERQERLARAVGLSIS